MLLRSASDAGRNGDPAEGGGVEGRAALAEQLRAKEAAGDACRSLPSRGNEPLVIILFGVVAAKVGVNAPGDQGEWCGETGDTFWWL